MTTKSYIEDPVQIQGEFSLLKGDASGIELLEKAAELDPCNPELFYRQGLALFEYGSVVGREKNLLLATKKFKIATRLNPQFFNAWHAWGNTLSLLGFTYDEHHYFIEAKEKLEKALSISEEAELYWDYGVVSTRIAENSGEATDLHTALSAFEKSARLRGNEILRFELRESSRGSSIANGSSITNTDPFAIEKPRGFDALKTQNFIAPQSSYQETLPQEFWNDYGTACLKMADCINDIRFIIKATNCFRHAVSLTLSCFEGWLFLARSMQRLYTHTHDENHFTQTHECFSAAAHLKPTNLDLWHEWAIFLLDAGRRTGDVKRLRAALEKCQHGYAFDPKHPLLLATLAEILATLGHLTDQIDLIGEAQNKISAALQITKEEDLDVWHSFGKCLYAFGGYFHDIDYYYQAIEKFQEGISLDRTRYQDWYAIAQVYTTVGQLDDDIDDYEKAVKFYSKAFDLKPIGSYYGEYAFALSRLGSLKQDKHLLSQAIAYFEYIFQIQKNGLDNHPEWLFHYAVALDQLGNVQDDDALHRKALETFSQVFMLNPDFPRLHYHIGLCLSHFEEIDYFYRALHHFHLAMIHEDDNDAVLLEWGTTLIHIGQHASDKNLYREAELKLIQAARLGNEEAFYQLGCLYSLLDFPEKALYFLRKSHAAETLPPIEELLDDDWLDNLRLTSSFQEFLAQLQHG